MDDLFPQENSDECRVCNEPVVDGRWSYCSPRCRDIAQAVQKMFLWDCVREAILERDEYTCQECGLSKEMWERAYWQVREIIDEKREHLDRQDEDEYQEWLDRRDALKEIYDVDSPAVGGYHVDHITRVADGGHPFDETNLRTLCKHCHKEKTARENSTREAQDVTLQDYLEMEGDA